MRGGIAEMDLLKKLVNRGNLHYHLEDNQKPVIICNFESIRDVLFPT